MEVRFPSSSLCSSREKWLSSLSHSLSNASPSCAPKTSDWPVSHYLRNNLPPGPVAKQILGRSPVGLARAEDVGCTSWRKSVSSSLLLARRFRRSDIPKVGFGRKRLQGRPMERILLPCVCRLKSSSEQDVDKGQEPEIDPDEEGGQLARGIGQVACWVVTVVYVGWLFLLPYAPGDPVWAITPSTIHMLIDQSLNFFFVLPLASILTNAAGFKGLTAPVQHPTSEALFNFVLGWTLLFAPLLFTDKKRDRFGGSLETLWIIQMFLTNTVLAPYMAIRQNSSPKGKASTPFQITLPLGINLKSVSSGMTSGACIVGGTSALVGIISLFWAFIGRPEAGFGGLAERWEYFINYVGSERLAYAFVWDIVLYTFFQPWLIGDNLENVKVERREAVRVLRFVPYVGLVAYVFGLHKQGSPNV